MEQYIKKSALVAVIENRIKELQNLHKENEEKLDSIQKTAILLCIDECKVILSLIDKLEVKEVDVDKEINEHAGYMPQSEFSHDSEVLENIEWAKNEFRYFFELGMSVSKK